MHIGRFRHIFVVDRGFVVVWWCWGATDPPPSPDPPQ
jgi:hypothetical protein